MGWFDKWLNQPIKLTDGEFWRGFFGSSTTSGESVTYEKAMALDAVWACVNLVSKTVGTLPCVVYGADGSTPAKDSQLYELLHDMPNVDDTAPEFWEMASMSLMLDGNFFAEKKLNAGKLVALNPLHPLAVEVCRSSDGRNTRFYEYRENGKIRKIPEERMFHVRAGRLPGCDRGMSPIGVVRNTVGNALAGEKASGKMFANGMMSSMVLTSEQMLKPEQRKQIGDTLKQFAGADKAGGVVVLEAGLTPHPLTIDPKDAQMLEARQFSVEQICRIFGIPPVMIGHAANGTTTWGSGIEQLILQFTKTCLRPMLKTIEAAIYRDLLDSKTRKQFTVEFNMEGLLRGDHAARAEFLAKMVNNGIYTRNEARAYENKPRMDGADELTAQTALAPLSTLGAPKVAAPASPQGTN